MSVQHTTISTTADGSHTLYSLQFGSTYHSDHGAIQESEHVFIKHGLHAMRDTDIHIFEMGFGTGLNVLMTLLNQVEGTRIHYHSIEAYPVDIAVIKQLNYTHKLSNAHAELFLKLHTLDWNVPHTLSETFSFLKIHKKIEDYDFSQENYNLVYYDAFGPGSQSELWEEKQVNKIVVGLKRPAMWVTFCAQGKFKRALKACGASVEALPGPPGKREMTRALFTNTHI